MSLKNNTTSLQEVLQILQNKASGGNGGLVERSENEIALITRTLSVYTNDTIEEIGDYTFAGCDYLTSVNFPAVTSIGDNAFYRCSCLTSANFPAAITIGYSAFDECYYLSSISFPVATSIGKAAFNHCPYLTSANFPVASAIGSSAFAFCYQLSSISFPVVTRIYNSAFFSCGDLESINFPNVTRLDEGAFISCPRLVSADFPAATWVGSSAFDGCANLKTINFPVASIIKSYAFAYCRSLVSASFPMCTTIENSAFAYCGNLSSVRLEASSICTLTASNAFQATPFAGYSSYFSGTPHIYVPASLITAYQTATNWTFFSKYFESMGNYLESISNRTMIFNATKSISAKIIFKDDSGNQVTPTVTITSADESIVNISNIQITTEQISFDVVSNSVTGEANITVTATYAEETLTEIFTIKVLETLPEPTYSVQSLDTTYTFTLNSNNYYESNNKGKDSSFAMCQVNIDAPADCFMCLDCINYAESAYDYGILSNLDSTLTLSYSADTVNVYKSFKGLSNSDIQTISYEVPEGQHYIYVKYIKDYSTGTNNDSFQFKVRFEY